MDSTPLTRDAAHASYSAGDTGAGGGAGAGAHGSGGGAVPATMTAAFYARCGPPSVMRVAQLPTPVPGADEVLVRVHAASLNPVDVKARASMAPVALLMGSPSEASPIVAGFDAAGVIVTVGANVTRWVVGDHVFCMANNMGSCAEYVAVNQSTLARKPASISFAEAASIPLAGLTAEQCLERSGVRDGSKVVITAGSGGVGSLAIQLAKIRGATVATTCSPRNFEFVKGLGADVTINYRTTTVRAALRGQEYDAAVDCTAEAFGLVPVLRHGGIVASILSIPSYSNLIELRTAYHKPLNGCLICCAGCLGFCTLSLCRPSTWCCCGSKSVSGLLTLPLGSDLERLGQYVNAGRLRPIIYRRFALADTAAAMACLEEGHAVGKIVIEVIPEAQGATASTSASAGNGVADVGRGAAAAPLP